jgi:hypothetical protein
MPPIFSGHGLSIVFRNQGRRPVRSLRLAAFIGDPQEYFASSAESAFFNRLVTDSESSPHGSNIACFAQVVNRGADEAKLPLPCAYLCLVPLRHQFLEELSASEVTRLERSRQPAVDLLEQGLELVQLFRAEKAQINRRGVRLRLGPLPRQHTLAQVTQQLVNGTGLAGKRDDGRHQGLGNRLIIEEESGVGSSGAIQCRQRLGGMLNYLLS